MTTAITNKNKKHGARLTILCLAAGCLLLTVLPATGQEGSGMTLSKFRTRQTNDEGRAEWELMGKEAEMGDIVINMKDIELLIFRPGKAEMLITSPSCKFNRATEVVSSESEVHAETEGFRVDGRGYRMMMEQQLLYIHQDVHMVLDRAQSPFEMEAPETPENGEEKSDDASTKAKPKEEPSDDQ